MTSTTSAGLLPLFSLALATEDQSNTEFQSDLNEDGWQAHLRTSLEENPGRLNALLAESIEETLTTLLSWKVFEALYLYLQDVHSIPADEVPCKLEILCSTLTALFGPSGSRTICKAIARKLFTKLGLTFSGNPERTLPEYVGDAKIKLANGEGQL